MNTQNIRVGTRSSKLALIQVKEIQEITQDSGIPVTFDIQTFESSGDIHKNIPLTDDVPDDFWTNTLDSALLDKEIDIAIHSAKDLPKRLADGLQIFALTPSADESDCYAGQSTIANLPGGTKVGTSSHLRQTELLRLNPGLDLVSIRGTVEERLELIREDKVAGIIVATVALRRLGLEEQIKEIMPWETTPLQGSLAIVGRQEDQGLAQLFQPMDMRRGYGLVQLVGAGPGDPELITLKGVNALKEADIVFYDYLAHPALLKHASKAEKVYVGKRKGVHAVTQKELSKSLREAAFKGKRVVRLKGGDPFIFGRGSEEITHLRDHHIPVEVIAGVSSATGILSQLGIPLTARDVSSSAAFVSGHGKEESTTDPQPIEIPQAETLVFLMGLTKFDYICSSLREKGWAKTTPVMVISKGTYWDQKIVEGSLEDIQEKVEEARLKPPALIVVGKVLNFYRPAELRRRNILFTGTNPEKYAGLGHIVHHPMIQLETRILSNTEVLDVSQKLGMIDFLILTSPFAVESFCGQMSIPEDRPFKIAVIGEETSRRLQNFSIKPDFVASIETSEGFFDEFFKTYSLSGVNILFPRSALTNPCLRDHLTDAGAHVEELTIYNNAVPKVVPLPTKGAIDGIVFTSPSTVKNFIQAYDEIPEKWYILAKGPVTQKYLKEAGYGSEII